MTRSFLVFLVLPQLLALTVARAAGEPPSAYYRWPALHEETVVFTAEGDLWRASLSGGTATRLSTHAATETNAAISPDGRWVAFSATYDGPLEAYVMPLAGGLPKRVSFENNRVLVAGWTPKGDVLYSARAASEPARDRNLYAVAPGSLQRRVFPVANATEAALDDQEKTLYFIRNGLHLTGDNVRRYRGGARALLYRLDLHASDAEATMLFNSLQGSARRPMWWRDRLYFLSDESGIYNIWTSNADGKDLHQLTFHRDFEARNASLSGGRIVYQFGADLRVYDIATGNDRNIAPALVSDFDQERARRVKDPLTFFDSATFAPNGDRVAISARGRVVLASTGVLRRVDVAVPHETRARAAVVSPDGKWVYAIGGGAGEDQIWRFAADGRDVARQLTHDGSAHRWRLRVSPDGNWLAYDDNRGRLFALNLESEQNVLLADTNSAGDDEIEEFRWAPDSSALIAIRSETSYKRDQLSIFSLATHNQAVLTSDRYEVTSAAFSPDGRWLYFIGNRNFSALQPEPWGDRNLGPYFDRRGQIYALALQSGLRFPFQPKDELEAAGLAGKGSERSEGGKPGDEKQDGKTKPSLPPIQYAGLAERLYEVPVASGNYDRLGVDAKRLYLLDRAAGPEAKPALKTIAVDADDPKLDVFAPDVADYALSADGRKIFLRRAAAKGLGAMLIVEAGASLPKELGAATVRIDDWSIDVDPRDEWNGIFLDAWRMHRDLLFDPKMRGLDWEAVRRKYAPLVARVTERGELDDVLALMIGELSILHSQVGRADVRRIADGAEPAFLGGVFDRVEPGYRISRLYRSDIELPFQRGPLLQPGLDVKEGDVIVAVNGQAANSVPDLSVLLRGRAGQQVLLDLARGAESRSVVVVPVNAERDSALHYSDWEIGRAAHVQQASQGRIGYLHLRAMTGDDIASFARDFYANLEREGLIIDVRRNDGGNIDSWIIEKLLRRVWAYWTQRAGGAPVTNQQRTFRGHLAVLADEYTYSDGETFTAAVKELKLGPVIGKRTAGAGVWLSDRNRLADNGIARVAESPQFALDGRWLIEGVGVAPDIEVDNPPVATFRGEDRQLDSAIDWLRKRIESEPVKPLNGNAATTR